MIRHLSIVCAALLALAFCGGCNRECCDREPVPSETVVESKPAAPNLGEFEAQCDIGTVTPPGTGTFDPASGTYTIASSGANIWAQHDDFHFIYRKESQNVMLTADIALDPAGANAHRKGGLMIRQSLDADAPYADVVVHGDGSIALQYRTAKGEITANIKSTVKAPATLRIARHGHTFVALLAPKDGTFETIGRIDIELTDPVYIGLAVSAHDAAKVEKAVFSKVAIQREK